MILIDNFKFDANAVKCKTFFFAAGRISFITWLGLFDGQINLHERIQGMPRRRIAI